MCHLFSILIVVQIHSSWLHYHEYGACYDLNDLTRLFIDCHFSIATRLWRYYTCSVRINKYLRLKRDIVYIALILGTSGWGTRYTLMLTMPSLAFSKTWFKMRTRILYSMWFSLITIGTQSSHGKWSSDWKSLKFWGTRNSFISIWPRESDAGNAYLTESMRIHLAVFLQLHVQVSITHSDSLSILAWQTYTAVDVTCDKKSQM